MQTVHRPLSVSRLSSVAHVDAAALELTRELTKLVGAIDVARKRSPSTTRRWNEDDTECTETTFEEGDSRVKYVVVVDERKREETVSPTHVTTIARVETVGLPTGVKLSVALWVMSLLSEAKDGSVSVEVDATPDRVSAIEAHVKAWASAP